MARENREALTMDHAGEGISFGRKKGCYLSNTVAGIMLISFIVIVIATGLLVYKLSDKSNGQTSVEYSILPNSGLHGTNREGKQIKTDVMEDKRNINVRLPDNLVPHHYLVRLLPFINGNFSIYGYVEVTFNVMKATDKIILHINDIKTKNDTAKVTLGNSSKGEIIKITKQEFEKTRQFYTATLQTPLEMGMNYTFSMEFEGFLNTNLDGFYQSSYKDETGKKKWLAATQFQPTDARKAFPCFDEPALKAEFSIILGRENGMTSISNMPLSKSEPIANMPGWYWDMYEKSVPMSTYLVAFIVSDFESLVSPGNQDYIFKVWARKGAISQAEYARRIGAPISQFFERYFNVKFPLPKQDMIALPDFSAGAMENWGLITYRETAMLYDPASTTSRWKQIIGNTITHEIAHQWFGNLVTPAWWTDLWLNEGFASYMAHIGLNAVEPSFKMLEQMVYEDLHTVFRLDALESSHPINIPVKHPDEINEIFDQISYLKGSSIIKMMTHFLKENTFRNGLTNYLNAFKYKSAEQDDLWRHLTEQAHKDGTLDNSLSVKEVMDTWTLQMGYPLITVTRKPSGIATIKQERFLMVKGENSTDKHDYKWWVPITYTTKRNPNFTKTTPTLWMKPSETEKTITGLAADQWVIFNIQQTGYYRVNYDQENWEAIIQQLQTDHKVISTVNRGQIIDDALSLSRAGILDYNFSMKILSYLKNEKDYVPWAAALRNLNFIEGMFAHKGGYGSLREFLLSLIIPMYDQFGFDNRILTDHLEKLISSKIVGNACHLSHKPCVHKAVSLFQSWMNEPDNYSIIPTDYKGIVYCTAIREGGIVEWKFAYNRYENTNVASEKRLLLSAMTCTKHQWILNGYIQRAIVPGSGIRKQDAQTVISGVAHNHAGKLIAWEFIKDKWDDILAYYGNVAFTLGGIVKGTTSNLNTRNQLKEFIEFSESKAKSLLPVKRSVSQALENTRNNIAWLDNNYGTIMKWLSDNGYSNDV